MHEQQTFDLSNFMPDSLQITTNSTPQTKKLNFSKSNYYEDFINQDPYKILKLVEFVPKRQAPEYEKGSEIQEFFRNSSIFITGGTGFLGKVVIEKLIRSVPNLKNIYILIRPKKGKSAMERFTQLMEDQVFLRMQTEMPQYLSKIKVVEGDICEAGLGLSAEDKQAITDQVDIVFNIAADVRFLEPIKKAIESNVLGTKRLLDLCKEISQLKAFVHVSTAYSHCVRDVIEEKIYRVYPNYEALTATLKDVPESEVEKFTTRILQNWPNTYSFSKALCEQMLFDEKENLPICIVRPSIVLPTYNEPVRGWCDNLYGPMAITLGVGLGVLRCGTTDPEASADFVPVDYVANILLAAAWKTGCESMKEEITVYNFTATAVRPTCWKDFENFLLHIKNIWPLQQSIWYPCYIQTSVSMYDYAHAVLHTIPGILLDKVAELIGKQPRLSKVYSKLYAMKDQMTYFSTKCWNWQSDNVWKVWNEMSEEDQRLFGFDLASVDLKEHLLVFKLGMRYFFLKDLMETIPAAMKKNKRLYWLHKALQLTFGFTVVKLMAMISHHLPI